MKTTIDIAYQNEGIYDRAILVVNAREVCSILYKECKDHIYINDFFNSCDYDCVLGLKLLVNEIAGNYKKVLIEENLDEAYGKMIREELTASEVDTYFWYIQWRRF